MILGIIVIIIIIIIILGLNTVIIYDGYAGKVAMCVMQQRTI